jgi:hypothetical protein
MSKQWRWDIRLVNEKSKEMKSEITLDVLVLNSIKHKHPEKFAKLKRLIEIADDDKFLNDPETWGMKKEEGVRELSSWTNSSIPEMEFVYNVGDEVQLSPAIIECTEKDVYWEDYMNQVKFIIKRMFTKGNDSCPRTEIESVDGTKKYNLGILFLMKVNNHV